MQLSIGPSGGFLPDDGLEASPFLRPCSLQAYAAARMAESVLLGMNGEKDIVECTFVESTLVPGLAYFASKVGRGGFCGVG